MIFADPKQPHTDDFDLKHPWFELNTGENVIKHYEDVGDPEGLPKRVIITSTTKNLENLAHARALHLDGTFKSCPKAWTQNFIITAEVTPRVWGKWSSDMYFLCTYYHCYIVTVPVVFGLLPNKKKASYAAFFGGIKNLLDDMDLEVTADYVMSDFEFNIK